MRFFSILGLFSLLTYWPLGTQANPENQPIVSCHIGGQLGNNLFSTATTLAYAWDYGAYPMFPGLNNTTLNQSYNRDRIFFRLDSREPPRPLNIFEEKTWGDETRIPFKPDQFLKGCFISWIHFHHYRNELLKIFAPHQSDIDYLNSKYADLLAHPNTVAVHVRTYNKKTHSGGLVFVGMDYYTKAFKEFPSDALFVIFSDRINWCKKHFSIYKRNMVFIDGNDHIQDLILMSMMKHNIIANSTFSWWGAYLNQNEGKVIVPRYWHILGKHKWPNAWPNTRYLPNWEPIENTLAPYPSDMRKYDPTSKSIDTQ